ncbi:hypothetical protein DVA44_21210 [Leclercia sp. W17]|nr:hypothetical protein DVA44_21210 [Leclercia sp. W17]
MLSISLDIIRIFARHTASIYAGWRCAYPAYEIKPQARASEAPPGNAVSASPSHAAPRCSLPARTSTYPCRSRRASARRAASR